MIVASESREYGCESGIVEEREIKNLVRVKLPFTKEAEFQHVIILRVHSGSTQSKTRTEPGRDIQMVTART